MKSLEITTSSAKETQKFACLFAKELLKSSLNRKGAFVVALEGNLGGGKTTFAQGFARGLGVREKVLSPTFVILKSFKLHSPAGGSCFKKLVHIDAYRLKSARELRSLGWQDILKDKDTIVLVEWADRVQRALPPAYIRISFEFLNEHERRIIIEHAH